MGRSREGRHSARQSWFRLCCSVRFRASSTTFSAQARVVVTRLAASGCGMVLMSVSSYLRKCWAGTVQWSFAFFPTSFELTKGQPDRRIHNCRSLKNAHLLRSPRPSSLRRTGLYASLLRTSGALHPGIFEQPAIRNFRRSGGSAWIWNS